MSQHELSPMKRAWKWLDNYWYHYKWHTLIAGFLIITILICSIQMLTKDDGDVYILYGGPQEFTPNATREIQNAFQSIMEEDYNGDGTKLVDLVNMLLMTDEQVQQAKDNAAEQGLILYYNQQTLNENQNKFTAHLLAGEASICLLDPSWYNSIKDNGGFARLQDVLGYQPEFALDDYTVRLKDTLFAQYFSALDDYPDDTLLCIRVKSMVGGFKGEKKQNIWYDNQVKMFRSIFAFDLVAEPDPAETALPQTEESTGANA